MGKKYQVLARRWSIKLLRFTFQELFILKEEETWPSGVQLYTVIVENSSYGWTPRKNTWGKSVRDLEVRVYGISNGKLKLQQRPKNPLHLAQ